MRPKQSLSTQNLATRRIVFALVAGVAFATSFYLVSIAVAKATVAIVSNMPENEVTSVQAHNEVAQEYGIPLRPVPVIISSASVELPVWAAPFWAGLAAVFGQSLALFVLFMRPQPPWSHSVKRAGLHARSGVTTGLMWIGIMPLLFIKVWFVYIVLLYGGNVWASAFGQPLATDPLIPFVPFGASSVVLILLLAFEPWRGLQLAYRCGWWPLVGVSLTSVLGVLLFLLGLLVFAGCAV